MPSDILQFFAYEHLPESLRNISRPIAQLAAQMDTVMANCPEKSAGLRKLLEAKDCFVRAALPAPVEPPKSAEVDPDAIPY